MLFHIHGGGFSNGSGGRHDGALLAEENDIVVVTINYRLGAFGFLNLPGLSSSGAGNYGLLDQVAALRWVNRNIAAFGGDPGRVTIAGLSTPSISMSDEQQRLALEIVRYLGAFVKTGRPQAAGQATWPGVRSEQVMSQRLGGSTAISGREFDADHQCDLWNSFDHPWLSVNPSDLAREVGVGSS